MKIQSSKSPSIRQELETLGRAIRDCETIIDQLKDRALDQAASLYREILLQGDRLRQVKKLLRHGIWKSWLADHFPKSDRTAQAYMRIAANPQRSALLLESRSLKQALNLLPEETDPGTAGNGSAAKQWPAFIEAVGRMAKVCSYIKKNPVADWPAENRDRLKEELLPLVQGLWPDHFQ